MRTDLTLRLVLMGGLVVMAFMAGCADQDPPCGSLPGNQEARDRACTDSSSPQFHLPAAECDASYVTGTFQPAWCEVGCTPAAAETGAACSNASNPFFRDTINCQATHAVGDQIGCCVAGTSNDPVWGTKNDAVMFFSCP
jgi:hypothetical protein